MIRILLADDHKLFREGIISLLDNNEKLCIVGEAENGKELINKYFELKPDLILSDINMPLGTGPESIQKIRNKNESPKVLFLSMYTGDEYIHYAIKSGALGLISKSVMKGELINAILTVAKGQKFFMGKSDEDLEHIKNKYSLVEKREKLYSIDPLTKKEIEVLSLVGEGYTSMEIAQKLEVSKRTIDAHRTKIMDKLNIRSLPAFIKYAVEFNISRKD